MRTTVRPLLFQVKQTWCGTLASAYRPHLEGYRRLQAKYHSPGVCFPGHVQVPALSGGGPEAVDKGQK